MINRSIGVLIVDDSAIVRGLLAKVLESDPDLRVVGTAMHGELALSWLRDNHADVMVLDVEMPVMDGLTTLTHIQKIYPHLPVVMASSLTQEGSAVTVKALALGATGCIAKPAGTGMAANIQQLSEEMIPLLKAVARKSAILPSDSESKTIPQRERSAVKLPAKHSTQPRLIVMGASTGGPKALSTVLSKLPEDFPVPILIVQHMPPTFTPMLARHLAHDTGRPCCEAQDGGVIEHGHTYIAPGDYHLSIDKEGDQMTLRLDQGPEEHFCRPSVNPLFRSAASWYGSDVLAVVLTGMGTDGIEGTRAIVQKGGYVIVQDEASSVVWGMPAAVVREGLADVVMPLQRIAPAVAELCMQEVAQR